MKIAAERNPYLPASFPFAKGKEEPWNGSPAHGGTLRRGRPSPAMVKAYLPLSAAHRGKAGIGGSPGGDFRSWKLTIALSLNLLHHVSCKVSSHNG